MAEEEGGGTIKIIMALIVIIALAWLLMAAYTKVIKGQAARELQKIGDKYAEPVEEPSFCRLNYENITTSQMLREYIYYIDIGNCMGSLFFDFNSDPSVQQEAVTKRGSPTIKNNVAMKCSWGSKTDKDYCGDILFDLTTGGKGDLKFSNMYYIDTGICKLNVNCSAPDGRSIYVCAKEKWRTQLFNYNKVSAGLDDIDSLTLTNDPAMMLRIGRSGNNIVICIDNKDQDWKDQLATFAAYAGELIQSPSKIWDAVKYGWTATIGKWI